MNIKTYVAGPIDANNYLLWDEYSKEALLIDCSEYKEEILSDIKSENLDLKYIMLTHGHFDHVMGVNEMAAATGAKVILHTNDRVLIENINEYGNIFLGLPDMEIPKIDEYINDGDVFEVGSNNIKVLHTPGHTEGSVCYLINDKLFCGDTLFKRSFGRTDLFGGDFSKIVNSIKNVIFNLSDDIEVYPGHGDATKIGVEKRFNEISRGVSL